MSFPSTDLKLISALSQVKAAIQRVLSTNLLILLSPGVYSSEEKGMMHLMPLYAQITDMDHLTEDDRAELSNCLGDWAFIKNLVVGEPVDAHYSI